MKENQSIRMEELPSRISFPSSPSNRVENGVDLEGEREGRRHGGRVEWGVEEKRMGGEEREGWLGGPVLG